MIDLARSLAVRKGARSLAAVPEYVLAALSCGEIETANLMEWLAADMARLASTVANELREPTIRDGLSAASKIMPGKSILQRLRIAGDALARAGFQIGDESYQILAAHRSDLVRQWACYAVNSNNFRGEVGKNLDHKIFDLAGGVDHPVEQRIKWTIPFAADSNMSVREAAWMAVRPHIAVNLSTALATLEGLVESGDPNVRRFAVEVTRPRSVWGSHIEALKAEPEIATRLLSRVRADPSRYVRLAVGNWMNDASKSRPEWVRATCAEWLQTDAAETTAIVRRGLRTIRAIESEFDPPRRRRENRGVVSDGRKGRET